MARQALKVLGGENPTTSQMEMCRTVGHAWDQWFPELEKPQFGWRLSLRCLRCTTERHDIVGGHGQLLSRVYYWCDGYRLEKGVERPTRESMREALFAHMRKELDRHNAVADKVLARSAS